MRNSLYELLIRIVRLVKLPATAHQPFLNRILKAKINQVFHLYEHFKRKLLCFEDDLSQNQNPLFSTSREYSLLFVESNQYFA
jgi:hypothetical protein